MVPVPQGLRIDAKNPLKTAVKITVIAKTCPLVYVLDTEIRMFQQAAGIVEPYLVKKFNNRFSAVFLEKFAKIAFRKKKILCDGS
jgi:hypothetical protein